MRAHQTRHLNAATDAGPEAERGAAKAEEIGHRIDAILHRTGFAEALPAPAAAPAARGLIPALAEMSGLALSADERRYLEGPIILHAAGGREADVPDWSFIRCGRSGWRSCWAARL